ncbi:RNA polymerase sigma-70 factor [Nocardia pseudobrasiliensis]|uniref:RNA polymerase ECF family sigma subunit n=1 Tax=Nocardia pseudobrasiliensis TaxID=45979 RepID=A0A370HMF1_9NOCA|nr:RNA polymerase sigma-70 factor [Nocardia pseudobrasiliensis]RDI59742.1 RNA polymerase ECF family sigma subunit [Nocardia pseudobrasiliensis]
MDEAGLAEFEARRPRLFALAYRMLGAAGEAEDVVQEAYLRWDGVDRAEIRSAEAWLTTVVVNLCRSWLDSARARRETYTGPWLPEPVPTGRGELGPLETAEQRELVSLAMLTLLERLSPIERAVFVLREAFGYPHAEIAELLELTEANCQQLYHRARQRIRVDRARFETPPERARELFERFLIAARTGDVAALERMFAADIVATADGGGKLNAARRPILGAQRVATYVAWLFDRDVPGIELAVEEINGAPALVARVQGEAILIASIDATEAGVAAVWVLVNPDKLAYFQRVDAL